MWMDGWMFVCLFVCLCVVFVYGSVTAERSSESALIHSSVWHAMFACEPLNQQTLPALSPTGLSVCMFDHSGSLSLSPVFSWSVGRSPHS